MVSAEANGPIRSMDDMDSQQTMRMPVPPRAHTCKHPLMSYLLLFVVMAAFAVLPVSSIPHLILKTTSAKCIMVDAAHETTLFIHYMAPDAVIPVDVEEEEEEEEAEEEETPEIYEGEGGNATGDPFANAMLLDKKPSFQDLGKISDKTFGAKYKKRMLEIKKKALKNRDMNIMVVSRPMSMLGQQGGHNVLVNKNRGTQKIVHQLEDKEGVLQFETGKIDGHVEICVQSLLATRQSPVRVGLNITAKSAPDENAMVDQPQYEPPLVLDPTRMLQFHTGGITDEMTKMHERVRDIVKYAEYSRDAEVGFHAHSLELNKAVRYWPAFRILILIVAGFLQVHYVLSYMKSRHYI